jgi:hypothetical protein
LEYSLETSEASFDFAKRSQKYVIEGAQSAEVSRGLKFDAGTQAAHLVTSSFCRVWAKAALSHPLMG